jgi:lipopolysaccharide transport system ATP-binding protein
MSNTNSPTHHNEVLIKCENVSKKFCRNFKQSLVYGLKDVLGTMVGKNMQHDRLRKNEFWAVKDINFELRRGECLGLIGHNGAGKSTLLKMLNGLITPDQGKITMRGRIGALIELGAGFNPILTGRENIYNNGAVLGFTRKEINTKFDSIVEFSEIGEFIDSPVQNYSSGMKVRLGFAVAAQLEPDILLIDEVLAVGDIGFRVKCLNKIASLMQKSAIIFVSHSMMQITRVCNSGLLMENGKTQLLTNNIGFLVQSYFLSFKAEEASTIGSGKAEINKFEIIGYSEIINSRYIIKNNTFDIKVHCSVKKDIKQFAVHYFIIDSESKPIAIASSLSDLTIFENDNEEYIIESNAPTIFSDGNYSLHITIVEILKDRTIGETLISKRGIANFTIAKNTYPTPVNIQIPATWKILK